VTEPKGRSGQRVARVEELSQEELIALVRESQRQMAAMREENARLKRSGRRQAAPFSKENPVPNRKKPGRKKGQGSIWTT
jgi:hypothetical protein